MPRPPEFVRDEVLESAMHLFWARGYASTSVQALLDTMKINRGSLYAAFRDKRSLFLEALERYDGMIRDMIAKVFAGGGDPLAELRRFFDVALLDLPDELRAKGCLVANTVSEQAQLDHGLAERANTKLAAIEGVFREALERSQAAGQVATDRDPAQLARYLMDTMLGLRTRARSGASREDLRKSVDTAFAAIA